MVQTRLNQSAVMTGLSELELQSSATPELQAGEILIEVRSVGVCGSDVHFFEHGKIGMDELEFPHVLGHEVSGVVAGYGPGTDEPPLGTLVAVEPSRPCNICRLCRTGQYNLCPEMRYLSAPGAAGAFTRYLTAPREFVFPVPDTLSPDAAALIEPLAVVVHAIRRARIAPGSRVLISGAGPIGLLATQVASTSGAAEVIISDVNPTRLARATAYGAQAVNVAQSTLSDAIEEPVDVFLECSGYLPALTQGIEYVRPGGTVVAVGMSPERNAVLPLGLMQAREITLVTSFRSSNAYPQAISLAATGKVDLESMVTGHFSLEEVQEALRASRVDRDAIKSIVKVSA